MQAAPTSCAARVKCHHCLRMHPPWNVHPLCCLSRHYHTVTMHRRVLGDGMVLQRSPASAVVWGFASPGVAVTTTFGDKTLTAMTDPHGIWRQALPPTPASKAGAEAKIGFSSTEGSAELSVLFGEVYMCSGVGYLHAASSSMHPRPCTATAERADPPHRKPVTVVVQWHRLGLQQIYAHATTSRAVVGGRGGRGGWSGQRGRRSSLASTL